MFGLLFFVVGIIIYLLVSRLREKESIEIQMLRDRLEAIEELYNNDDDTWGY